MDLQQLKQKMISGQKRQQIRIGELLLFVAEPSEQTKFEAITAARLVIEKKLSGLGAELKNNPLDKVKYKAFVKQFESGERTHAQAKELLSGMGYGEPRNQYEYECLQMGVVTAINYISCASLHLEDGTPLASDSEAFEYFLGAHFTADRRTEINEALESIKEESDPQLALTSTASSPNGQGTQLGVVDTTVS